MKKILFLLSVIFICLNSNAQTEFWGICGGGSDSYSNIFSLNNSGNTFHSEFNDFYQNYAGGPEYTELIESESGVFYGLSNSSWVGGNLFQYNLNTNRIVNKVTIGTPSAIGKNPLGSLLKANDGKFYGMTVFGGSNSTGVLFQYDPATNTYVKKIDFTVSTGHSPSGSLIQAADGMLYGMTKSGGSNGGGTLFKYDITTDVFTKLIDFAAATGVSPRGTLLQASDGMLYGLTNSGGANSKGVLFQFNTLTNLFTKKIDFDGTTNGSNPEGKLIEASDGNLYGMAYSGGINNKGTLFQYNFNTNILTKKLDFAGTSNGANPLGSLMQANNNKIYGMVTSGGTFGNGVLFQYDYLNNIYTKRLDFDAVNTGADSRGTLMQAMDGKLYGLTKSGGTASGGVLFQYDIITNTYLKKIDLMSRPNGDTPAGSLIQATDQTIYGVNDRGVFQYDPLNKIFTKKAAFSTNTGGPPIGSLIQASDGKMYGTTYNNGPIGGGVLYQFDPLTNIITTKVSFDGTNKGSQPSGKLIQATDGKLYGMTKYGGVNNKGVLFQYDPATNVFTKMIDFNGGNGALPVGGLIQASDGKIYGMTTEGGLFTYGVLFQHDITTNTLVKKLDFRGALNGSLPFGDLIQASNGKLYGLTSSGGINNGGVLFQYNIITDSLLKKYEFSYGTIADRPRSTLMQASNGNLYGTAIYGGAYNLGFVFRYNPVTEFFGTTFDFDGITSSSTGNNMQFIEVNFRIVTSTLSSAMCAGSNILVPYKVVGTYDPGNVFTAQLSDEFGSFASPITLGSLASISAGTINGFIPTNITLGSAYRVRVISNNPAIIGSDNGSNITISASPVPTVTLNSGSICSGSNFTLTPSGAATYTYLNGGAIVNPIVSTTYTVIGTGINGCSSLATSSVTVNSTPTLTVNSGTICAGNSFTVIPNGAITYTYSSGSALITPAVNTTFTVSGENAFGCIGSAIGNITVNAAPTITVNSGFICNGQSFTMTPAGASTYTFSSGSAIVSPTAIANYTVTGTDLNSCSNTAISSVSVNALPSFTLSALSGTTTCSNPVVGFSVTTADSFLWTGPGAINPAPTVQTVTLTTSGIYTLTITDVNSCVNTGTLEVMSNVVPPTFTLTPSNLFSCAASPVSITANLTGTNSASYLWDNASTTQSISVSPTVTTVYTATVTDNLNGCYSSNSTTVNVYALPSLTVTGTNTVCLGTSSGFIANGAMSYTWNTGQTTASISVNPTSTTIYTVWGSDLNSCINSQTVSVTVDNTCADVWPGDANSDGLANNLDVLELGLHYTQTGAPRASINNNWQSYFANNWTGTIANGKNLNHGDCNGDGIINDDDTLAIYNNYGLTHAFKPAQTNIINPQLTIVPDQAMVVKGTWGTASIYLGDATSQINNINGIAFTVDFDNTLIEPNSIWIEYINSFIDASQNLYFRKLDFASSKLYTASTHTVSNNVNGFGKIATLHYQIKSNLTTDEVLNVGISQANQSDASGVISPLTSGTGTLMAIGASVGIQENSFGSNVLISPNPTNGLLNISFNTLPQNTKIELYNNIGALVLTEVMSNRNNTINVSELSSGIYFMKVLEGNNVVAVKKVVRE
jgi:uncharacterized repeat protein (TIGR03803 family)